MNVSSDFREAGAMGSNGAYSKDMTAKMPRSLFGWKMYQENQQENSEDSTWYLWLLCTLDGVSIIWIVSLCSYPFSSHPTHREIGGTTLW